MKINRFSVKNFRQFDNLVLEFPDLITAFVGQNGSGKTTILEAIDIATTTFSPENKIKTDDFFDSALPIKFAIEFDDFFFINVDDGWVKRKIPSKIISLEINPRSASSNKVFNRPYTSKFLVVPTAFTAKGALGLSAEQLEDVPESIARSNGRFTYTRDNGNAVSLGELQLGAVQNLVDFPAVFYFGSRREKELRNGFNTIWGKTIDELDWRFFKKYLELDDTSKTEYLNSINDLANTINTTTTGTRRRQIVITLISEAIDLLGTSFSKLEISYNDPEKPHRNAELTLKNDDRVLSLDKLGAGERGILAILLSKIVAKLSKNSVIFLIDELETHLHPQLQKSLLKRLQNEDSQIIYSTHSENLIDLGKWKTVMRLSGGEVYPKRGTLDELFENKKIEDHLNEISLYYQDKTILKQEDAQALFGDKTLIVEGPKDKYCIPVAATKLGQDISHVPTIISANSKSNIPHYQIISKAFGIDSFAVYDKDSDTAEQVAKNDRIKLLAVDKYFEFSTSFEDAVKKSKMNEIMTEFESGNIPEEVKDCVQAVFNWLNQ